MKKYLIASFIITFSISSFLFVLFPKNAAERQVNRNAVTSKYPIHKDIVATVFWVGEEEGEDNGYISNQQSAWDSNWVESFGGIDDPQRRIGFFPQDFTPSENPFYLALPYSDFDYLGRKENSTKIPWYEEGTDPLVSIVKNRWVKILHRGRACYGQWENAGPFQSDDLDYVFGNSRPKNTFGQKAGIDVSPALRDCLGIRSSGLVDWQFIEEEEIPNGPWKLIVTESDPNWQN